MRMVSALCSTTWRVTELTMSALTFSRSSRDMPGLRGRPAVMTVTSEPAVMRVVVAALDDGVEPVDGRGLHEVERLALGHARVDVDEGDVLDDVHARDALGDGGADVAGADDGDLHVCEG